MEDPWPRFSLKEIQNEDESSNKYFLLLNRHPTNGKLKMSLLNGVKSYECKLSLDEIEDMAKKCRIPLPEFTNITITALTWQQLTKESFIYNMSETDDTLQLTWKKVVPGEGIKIKLGSLSFKNVNNAEEICNVLRLVCTLMAVKNDEIHQLQTEKRELLNTNKQQKAVLDNEIESKEELEKELYTKFVLVLNRKKEKCREYKGQLANQKRTATVAAISDEESEVEEMTLARKADNSLLFEDSDEDSLPRSTQRVVKNKKLKTDMGPDKKLLKTEKKTDKKKSSNTKTRDVYELDTQELLSDF